MSLSPLPQMTRNLTISENQENEQPNSNKSTTRYNHYGLKKRPPRFKFRLNGNDRRLPLTSRKSCGLSENVLFDVLEIVVFEQNPNI